MPGTLVALHEQALVAVHGAEHRLADDVPTLARAIRTRIADNPSFISELVRHAADFGTSGQGSHEVIEHLGVTQGPPDVVGRQLSHLSKNPLRSAFRNHPTGERAMGEPWATVVRDVQNLLPPRNGRFVDRPGLIRAVDEAPEDEPTVLWGLGGAGKTTAACEWVHRQVEDRGAVEFAWWFAADDRVALVTAMAGVYERLNPSFQGQDAYVNARAFANWLSASASSWRLVLDDAAGPQTVHDLIPSGGKGRVLITSRRRDWSSLRVHPVWVDRLESSTATTLLEVRTGLGDPDGAGALAADLGGWALALEQAAAFLIRTGWGYGRYRDALAAHPLRLHGKDLAEIGSTTATVWETSLDRVTANSAYGTKVRDILGVLAYLASDDIPRSLFDTERTRESPLRFDPLDASLALAGLADYSLVTLTSTAVAVHPVVQQLTRLHDRQECRETSYAAAAVDLLRRAYDEAIETTARLLPHLIEVSSQAASLAIAAESTVSLLNDVARDRLSAGQLDIANQLLQRARQRADELGPDHPETLATRKELASWLATTGRIADAITSFQELLVDQLRVLGPDHLLTFSTRYELAFSLGWAGRTGEAISGFEELLADQLRVLGPDHPDSLRVRCDFAYWLREAGRVAEAITRSEEVIADQLRVLGPDHPHTLDSRNDLVLTLAVAGRTAEAITRSKELLADYMRVLGPDHLDTLRSRFHLAFSLGQAGRTSEAITRSRELLPDQLRVLGSDHRHTLRSRHHLASLLGQVGHTSEAITRLEELLTDELRILGPDHPYTLRSRHELAHCLGQTGHTGEAISRLEELLADELRVFGSDHPHTLTTRHELASCLGEAGRTGEAITQFEELLADRLRVLGPNHPDTLKTRDKRSAFLREAE